LIGGETVNRMNLTYYLCALIGSENKPTMIKFDDTEIAFAVRNDAELDRSHFVFGMMKYPLMVKIGTYITLIALSLKLPVKKLIKKTLFFQFCGGESIEGCQESIANLSRFNVKTILDFSAEGQEDEVSFDYTRDQVIATAHVAKDHPDIPFCVVKLTGLGSRELMTKIQAGKALSTAEQAAFQRFKDRVESIAKAAHDNGIKFMIDAEETWIQDVVDRVAYDLMLKYNEKRPVVYNTYQFYCHEALEKMKKGYEEITGAGCFFAAKYVRGAYMEKERERAAEMGYRDPIQPNKPATDADYNSAQEFAIQHIENFSLLSGTHNEFSSAYLADLMEQYGIAKDDERVYFSQLLGMSDHISFKLSSEGYNVAKYMPYGPVEKVLPYLFRRAEENTSVKGQSGRELSLIKTEIKRRKQK
jgi:proline dehydrogenase